MLQVRGYRWVWATARDQEGRTREPPVVRRIGHLHPVRWRGVTGTRIGGVDVTDDERVTRGMQTTAIHAAEDPRRYLGAVVPPIFASSLFTFADYDAADQAFAHPVDSYIYSRGLNPTVEIVEKKIAALEKGEAARCFASGMAAISSSLLHFLRSGDHVISIDTVYGPARRLLVEVFPRYGIQTTLVEGTEVDDFSRAIRPNTRVIYLETPSSLFFKLQDLEAVARLAKGHGIITITDNSWSSPFFQRPLSLGIDVVVHSASKYLGGHSDLVAGAVVAREDLVREIAETEQALLGGVLGPFEAWLLMRGLRTLGLRMERHQQNALAMIRFLDRQSAVGAIHYPGAQDFAQRELALRQMSGFSGLLSFELDADEAGVKAFVNSLAYFRLGVSWGGFESLVFAPSISSSGDAGPEIPSGLIRMHVGLEDIEDLMNDVGRALATMIKRGT